MALIHCDFYSKELKMPTSMNVILPQPAENKTGIKDNSAGSILHPALYFFHGMPGNYTSLQRRTSIERYVEHLGLAVIMPDIGKSFYCNMQTKDKYWTFVRDELPEICREFFHLSSSREDNFVAGISMGGYGAMKLGLLCPDKFTCAASFSGPLDICRLIASGYIEDIHNILGSSKNLQGTENDLFYLVEQVAASNRPRPLLYQYCGTDDFLYADNQRFKKHCDRLGLNLIYEEEPANHDWGYWDKNIQSFLDKLPLKKL